MKLKLTLLMAAAFLTLIQVYGQRLPDKKQQYEFLKWYIKNSPQKTQNLLVSLEHFENFAFKLSNLNHLKTSPGSANLLSQEDTVSMRLQISINNKSIRLDTTFLPGVNWRPKSAGNSEPSTSISLPVFSKDGHLAFINRSYWCGSLCGDGGVEVYEKVKGGWRLLTVPISHWVS